jgi:hypothetical protein
VANSRPIQFVHYAMCGHSTPVRGSGATVNRLCQSCADNGRRYTGLGMITLERLLGRRPTGYLLKTHEESPQ